MSCRTRTLVARASVNFDHCMKSSLQKFNRKTPEFYLIAACKDSYVIIACGFD